MEDPNHKRQKKIETPVISVNNISIRYEDLQVIKDLSFQISKGEKVVITGESGRGKSTILNALLGFIPLYDGEIYFYDKKLSSQNLQEIRSKTAWLPQETALQFESIHDIIYSLFTLKANRSNAPSKSTIDQTLKNLNIAPEILDKEIDEISGGQKQRILLAGALLLKKEILIMDEPTSDLDEKNKKLITDFILSQKELTVIAVSHDAYWTEKSNKIIDL